MKRKNLLSKKGLLMTLPSWNNTQTKQTILNFVAAVTDENGPNYVPPAERIATFDNDGTLWCEHPIPVQFHGTLDGLTLLVEKKPQLMEQPLYKAAVEKDLAWFLPYMNNERLPELLAMLLEAAAGETQAEYDARITAWLETARHPLFGKPYKKMAFTPMVELLDYLRANEFRVFIVSGSGMDFVRLFSEEVYGVPRENVVGANIKLGWEYRDGTPVLVRQAGIVEPYCDGPGKPINIELHVGRPPDYWYWGHSHHGVVYSEHLVAGETTRCRVSGHGSTPHAAPWELREHTGPGQPIQWYANTPYDDDVPEHEKRILNGFTHVTFTENDVVERYINPKGDVEIEI